MCCASQRANLHQSSWEAPSVLMLCTSVFIFTSGSSALLGRPRCGLSIWLSILAIFNTLSWVYAIFFSWENTKTLGTTIFVQYEYVCRRLQDVQSINSERVSSRLHWTRTWANTNSQESETICWGHTCAKYRGSRADSRRKHWRIYCVAQSLNLL